MANFWGGHVLLIGDFKNRKAYQNMRGSRWSDNFFFYQENFYQSGS